MPVQITHIRVEGPIPAHEYVSGLYWVEDGTGKTGTATKAEMIEWIAQGNTAYVSDGQTAAIIHVVRPEGVQPFLRTQADGDWSDNLLALPRF
ncbi:DUF3892 domain-containing protein [Sinomonas sp. ASV322]|uniref:DUF3892 domain-containing protein n=1 Tax=Sinomonas sp. ASV322 TaxID=3041920 RepID=UPI0027DAC09C|nr:DUF3892 domain-containing protein [Sinomonas sp. ASV322]MDQ4503647.1 DUF3892 domain-containing protein [Sinomonas sp. ASV322]